MNEYQKAYDALLAMIIVKCKGKNLDIHMKNLNKLKELIK